MRELTGATRIRIKEPLPLPRKRELTGDTRIRLSQIADLKDWALEMAQGEAAPEGTVHHWSDGDHVKKDGKWVPVISSKNAAGSKEEESQSTGGEKAGAIDTKSSEEKKAYAARTYLTYKNRKSKSDVPKVAKAARMSEADIKKIRFHIFEDRNIKFDDGKIGGFYPSWRIAQAWQRLERGHPKETDLILLKHELRELTLMQKYGFSYDKAHLIANLKYPWEFKIKGKWRNEDDATLQKICRDRLDYYLHNGSDIGWTYRDKQKDPGNKNS